MPAMFLVESAMPHHFANVASLLRITRRVMLCVRVGRHMPQQGVF
jgi:hypothetical protein